MRRTVLIVLGLVVLALAGGYAYLNFSNADEPAPVALSEQPTAEAEPIATAGPADLSGEWRLAGGGADFVGYRVGEQLASLEVPNDAVGRTPAVTGTMTIEGSQVTTVEITADLTQLASDEPRRDNAIRTNGLESERYPDAVFTLTEPVDLGTPVAGEVLEASAAGELTLREQVTPVTLNLEARWTGEQIEVAGDAPVRLSDFGIDAPVLGPVVSIEDEAVVELQVVFVR